MKLNQVTANLDFIASTIQSLNVDSKLHRITSENKREFCLDIKCTKPIVKENAKFGKLLMRVGVTVMHENAELPADTFDLVIEGVFSAPATIDDEEFLGLLNVNGGAALYSIARAKIESISSLTYMEGKILLPLVNIVQYYKERDQEDE